MRPQPLVSKSGSVDTNISDRFSAIGNEKAFGLVLAFHAVFCAPHKAMRRYHFDLVLTHARRAHSQRHAAVRLLHSYLYAGSVCIRVNSATDIASTSDHVINFTRSGKSK